MIKNEKGLTLIELMITLAIFSIIGTLVWNVLNQGVEFSEMNQKQTHIQQELNILLTALTRTHQTSDEKYTITLDQNPHAHSITISSSDLDQTSHFSNPNFTYTLKNLVPETEITIDPNQCDLPVVLVVHDQERENVSVEIKTIIAKIRGGTDDESCYQ